VGPGAIVGAPENLAVPDFGGSLGNDRNLENGMAQWFKTTEEACGGESNERAGIGELHRGPARESAGACLSRGYGISVRRAEWGVGTRIGAGMGCGEPELDAKCGGRL
jgi:hypothetical protein